MFDFLLMLIFVVFCALINVLVIYSIIKRNKYLKKGVPVKLKVIDVKNFSTDEGIPYAYNTTFEFEYNGNIIRKTMKTKAFFTIGNEYEGLYLPDGSKNCITVEGEGSHLDKGSVLIFITTSFALMFLGIDIYFELEFEKILGIFAVFIILILIEYGIYNVLNNRKKSKIYKDENERIYNKNINRKNDSDLIRYYPDTDKK